MVEKYIYIRLLQFDGQAEYNNEKILAPPPQETLVETINLPKDHWNCGEEPTPTLQHG